MQPLQFGPLEIADLVALVILVLVIANLGVRLLAHRTHVRQADENGEEGIARYPLLEASNVVLVLAGFYYITVQYHAGIIISVLALGVFVSDFFEFEARKVEARQDRPLDLPKGSIGASAVLLLYASYDSLFFLVEPLWNAIV